MMTEKKNIFREQVFFGIVAALFTNLAVGQTTVNYTMQTSNFNAIQTSTPSGTYAGAYDNGSNEVGTYANGSSPTPPGVSIFRTFSVDGSTSGVPRVLQVGDRFSIQGYVSNNSSFWSNSSAGISLNNGTLNNSFSDYNSGQRLKLQISQGGSWYVAGAAAAAGYADAGQDVTFTFKVTSSNTVNVEITRANTSPQTGATTSELELTGSGSIQSFSIWNQASGGGNNMFWKNCSLVSTGSVELGGNNQTNSLTTISGVISDGLAANSTSTASANSVIKNGTGTITLTGANTYTGATSVSSGTLVVSGSGTLGSGSAVTVSSGATLRIDNSITIASLDNSGTVEIYPGKTLTISGNVINSASGTITINADNTGYGQLKVGGTVSNSGTVTQEQYIASTGHHGISSPMSSGFGTTTNCTPGSLYEYDASNTGNYVGTYVSNGNASTSTVGRGFFAPVGNAGDFMTSTGTFSVSGTPNTSHDWTLSYVGNSQSGASGDGWNLIGNPYSATLDWSSVNVGSSVNGAVYVWDPSASQYMSWTLAGGGVNGGSQYIPPMQAFWVQTVSGGTGTAYDINTTMSSNTLTTQAPTFFKTQNDVLKLSVVNLSDNTKNDETVIAHSAGSSDGFDAKLDAWKLDNYGGNPNIYSCYNGDKMAINATDLTSSASIPIGVKAPVAGQKYSLALEQIVNNHTYQVVLQDKLFNTFTDIAADGYVFTHGAWHYEDPRFVLHINQSTVGVDESKTIGVKSYQQGNRLVIHGSAQYHSAFKIMLLDCREVEAGQLQNGMASIEAPKAGVYIVQFEGLNSQAERVVIQ